VTPSISVVIPTYRRPDLLDGCLTSLERQTVGHDEAEIVVVDDGSGDATQDVLRSWSERLPNLRAFEQALNRGPAAARNRAVGEASAELVLFLDDDVVATPDLVARHLAHHRQVTDPTQGLLGRIEWLPDLTVTAFMRWLDGSGLQFGYDTWLRDGPVEPPYAAFYTANLSMNRQQFMDAGGFDERFPYPAYEDFELAFRLTEAGFRLEYRSDIIGYHSRAITLPDFARRMGMVAESAALMAIIRPEFPIEDPGLGRIDTRRRTRLLLRLAALAGPRLAGGRLLDRYFRTEVAAGFKDGRARAAQRATDASGGPPS